MQCWFHLTYYNPINNMKPILGIIVAIVAIILMYIIATVTFISSLVKLILLLGIGFALHLAKKDLNK